MIASTLLCVALYGLIHYLVINNDLAFELVEWRINRALTGSGRFDLWSYSFDKILESPYLGIGLNQTRDLISDFEVKKPPQHIFRDIANFWYRWIYRIYFIPNIFIYVCN